MKRLFWLLVLSAPLRADVVTRGPYLQMMGPDAVTVRWRTDAADTGRIRVGLSTSTLGSPADEVSSRTEHEVRLTGLTASTTYFYEVGTTAGAALAGGTTDFFFVTAPTPGSAGPVRVWVVGDPGVSALGAPQGIANQAAVRDAYLAYTGSRRTDLWLMLGDNAYMDGSDTQYQAGVFDVYPALLRTSPLWPAPGNHDYGGSGEDYGPTSSASAYMSIFSLPTAGEEGGVASSTEAYYSFDYGDVHFISLDSHHSAAYDTAAMLAWLRADLAATTRTWKIAYWHHPPYTHGSHDSDSATDSCTAANDHCRMTIMRQAVLPILEAAGVDLVLCGHSHTYERSVLLHGHYGRSNTLTGAMKLDKSAGAPSAPYVKYDGGGGTVYAVNGTGGQISAGSMDHPVMAKSVLELGSMVLDIAGNRLDAVFLGVSGVRDSFSIVKTSGPRPEAPSPVTAYPNPFNPSGDRMMVLDGVASDARFRIFTMTGELVRELPSDGTTSRLWDGRNASGKPAAPGIYVGVTRGTDEKETTRRLVLTR
jgi:3',5'-cyclic AMP phosphodiesterase CpdA